MFNEGMRAKGTIILQILGDERPVTQENSDFRFETPGVEGYIIGRSDAPSGYKPDLDLAPYGAQDRGISRRHAVFVNHRNLIHILDLGSMNGTFINGKRISPKVAYVLNIGDKLSLANIDMIVSQIAEDRV